MEVLWDIPLLLGYESGWSIIIALAASWIICKILDWGPVQKAILPSKDLREKADKHLEEKEASKWTNADLQMYSGLCMVDARRLILVAIVFAAVLMAIAPLL